MSAELASTTGIEFLSLNVAKGRKRKFSADSWCQFKSNWYNLVICNAVRLIAVTQFSRLGINNLRPR
jgi:hypothetical protein